MKQKLTTLSSVLYSEVINQMPWAKSSVDNKFGLKMLFN